MPSALEPLLEEFTQLGVWAAAAATEDLRAMLSARRTDVALRVTDALVTLRGAAQQSSAASPPDTPVASSAPQVPAAPDAAPPSATDTTAASPDRAAPAEALEAAPKLSRPLPPRPSAAVVQYPAPHAFGVGLRPLRAPPLPRFPMDAEPEAAPPPPVAEDWAARAAAFAAELMADAPDRVVAVTRAIDGADRWRVLPAEAQRKLASMAAAALHVLESANPGDPRVGGAFSQLSAFMKRARPGYVNGLARTHRPEGPSWAADAADAHSALLANLPPQAPSKLGSEAERAVTQLEALVNEARAADGPIREAIVTQVRRDLRALLHSGAYAAHPRVQAIARFGDGVA